MDISLFFYICYSPVEPPTLDRFTSTYLLSLNSHLFWSNETINRTNAANKIYLVRKVFQNKTKTNIWKHD